MAYASELSKPGRSPGLALRGIGGSIADTAIRAPTPHRTINLATARQTRFKVASDPAKELDNLRKQDKFTRILRSAEPDWPSAMERRRARSRRPASANEQRRGPRTARYFQAGYRSHRNPKAWKHLRMQAERREKAIDALEGKGAVVDAVDEMMPGSPDSRAGDYWGEDELKEIPGFGPGVRSSTLPGVQRVSASRQGMLVHDEGRASRPHSASLRGYGRPNSGSQRPDSAASARARNHFKTLSPRSPRPISEIDFSPFRYKDFNGPRVGPRPYGEFSKYIDASIRQSGGKFEKPKKL